MAERKRYLFVCVNRRPNGAPNGSCAARGSIELHARLNELLQERGLSQFEARACTSSCLDACWAGPVIAVEPDGFFYGRVQASELDRIVQGLEEGQRLESRVLADEDFEAPRELRERAARAQ